MTFVAIKRQRIKVLEVIATCRASISAANPALGAKVIESAQEALRAYIQEAENLLREEKKTEEDLVAILSKEAKKAYLIQSL